MIAAYVRDAELMHKDFSKMELESMSQNCKKCDFDTISEGMLKRHRVLIHDSSKENNQSKDLESKLEKVQFKISN